MTDSERKETVRAFCLMSGGLDSLLAACLLKRQGIDVQGIAFESPFFGSERARSSANHIGIPLHVVEFTDDILAILRSPRHGFGSQMNPCIDCHAAMIRRAGNMMAEQGVRFLATGEVLNQRPMSQNRQSLEIVARESGYPDLLLRPLSALLLPETEPERRKWVDRSRLMGIEGRSRHIQLHMAAEFGITDYVAGSGGCRLTEPHFAGRLRELREHEGLSSVSAVQLLRIGRHFRLADRVKLIVGRNKADNDRLESAASMGDAILRPLHIPGPIGLLTGAGLDAHIEMAAAICARYCDSSPENTVAVVVEHNGARRNVSVSRIPDRYLSEIRIS